MKYANLLYFYEEMIPLKYIETFNSGQKLVSNSYGFIIFSPNNHIAFHEEILLFLSFSKVKVYLLNVINTK